MKRIILLLCLVFISVQLSFSQWIFVEGGNSFDGHYKAASVKGKGERFPYNSPSIVINQFDSGSENFYIKDIGSYTSGSSPEIQFYFDNLSTVYYVDDYTSEDDVLFINEVRNRENDARLSKIELINLLKKHSKVRFRVSDEYSKNDAIFSLSGSTSVLNRLYLDLSKTNEKSKQLISKVEGEGLNARDLEIVKNQLHKEMNLTWQTPSINKKVIDLTIKPVLEYEYDTFIGYVNVFIVYDDDKLQIGKEFRVAEGSPIYDRIDEEIIEIQKEEELEFEKLGVKKFKIRRLIKTIIDKIEKLDYYAKQWNTDDIIEVRGLITGSFRGKYSTFELKIEIEGEGIKKYELYIGKLNINDDELKKAGLQPHIEF